MESVPRKWKAVNLGERLRTARETADLTQNELGAVLGVSSRAVQTWERGDAYPRARHARIVKAWLDEREDVAA